MELFLLLTWSEHCKNESVRPYITENISAPLIVPAYTGTLHFPVIQIRLGPRDWVLASTKQHTVHRGLGITSPCFLLPQWPGRLLFKTAAPHNGKSLYPYLRGVSPKRTIQPELDHDRSKKKKPLVCWFSWLKQQTLSIQGSKFHLSVDTVWSTR